MEPQFDPKKIRRRIMSLRKLGYIVTEKVNYESTSKNGWYSPGSTYWRIGKPDEKHHIGIGYINVNNVKPCTDYYFHNGHSGNILTPNESLGSTWNHSNKNKPGPGGWYTFDEAYVKNIIDNLKQ